MNCTVVIKVSGVGYSGHGQVFLDDQPANDYTDTGLTNLVKVRCYFCFLIFGISCCLFPSLIVLVILLYYLTNLTLYLAFIYMLVGEKF